MILVKKIKKVSFLLVLIFLFNTFLTACNSNKNPHSEIQYTNVYRTQYLEIPDGYSYRDNNAYVADDKIYINYFKIIKKYEIDNILYIYDTNGEVIDIINLNLGINDIINFAVPAKDGTLYVITSTSLKNITIDCKLIWEVSFAEAFNIENLVLNIVDIYLDNEKNYLYIVDANYVYVFKTKGELVHSFKLADYIKGWDRIDNITKTPDGQIIFKLYTPGNYINNISNNLNAFYTIDTDSKKIMEYKPPEMSENDNYIGYYTYYDINYSSEYDIYYKNDYGLYGQNFDDTEPELLISWINSDIYDASCNVISVITPETVLCVLNDITDTENKKPALLIHIPDDEVIPKTILNIAAVFPVQDLRQVTAMFNRQNDKYRVVINDYSMNSENAVNLFNLDIASGNVHDMVFLTKAMPIESYISKGMFADLYKLFDADPDISSDNLLGILKRKYENDSHLYTLPLSYSVLTLAGKSSLIGAKESLTIDEVIEINKNLPPDTALFTYSGRTRALDNILQAGASSYINYKNAACNFNDNSFIKMIGFVKTLSETALSNKNYFMDEEEILNTIRNDKSYLHEFFIHEVQLLFRMKYYYGEDEYVIKGFPNQVGNGSIIDCHYFISISEKSANKEGALEFIKYWLSDEIQRSLRYMTLPVTNSALQNMIDEYMSKYCYEAQSAPFGLHFHDEPLPENVISYNNYKEYHFTEENAAKIVKFFNNIEVTPKYDNTVLSIITEETSAFFSDVITAEQCAKYIQNRVSTYLNEQK